MLNLNGIIFAGLQTQQKAGPGEIFWLMFWALFLVVTLAGYLIDAYSLSVIAKRRGIDRSWLAWIPVAQHWILGSLADHYQLTTHYATKNRRRILLFLQIALVTLLLLMLIFVATTIVSIQNVTEGHPFMDVWKPVRENMQDMVILYVLILILAFVFQVVRYVALFDVYRSCAPEEAVLFLALSIAFGILQPFFLLFLRNRDDGLLQPENRLKL